MNVDRSYNFDYCCRTCLNATNSNKMFDIFSEINDCVNLADVLNKCTSIHVSRDDELPKKLCSQCFISIKTFFEFCKSAEEVNETLRLQIKKESGTECPITATPLDTYRPIKPEYDDDQTIDDNVLDTEISNDFCNKTEKKYSESLLTSNNNVENIEVLVDSHELLKLKLKCEICNKKFKKLASLNYHKKKHEVKDVKKQFKCDICLKKYTDHYKFVKHLNKHNQSNSEPKPKSHKYQKNLLTNIAATCEECSSVFKSPNALSAHMRKHAKKDRVLACTICGKVFAKVSHLKRHELCHEANRPFKCTLCTKTFAKECSLKEHINKHNGIKPHPCPMCSKSFSHLTTLTSHIRIHMKEKPYLCPTCGKRFDSSTNLNQHMKRHQGLKLFACTMCPRKFVSKGELKSHNITHTGERSFACEQCGATFTKRTSLAKHNLRHLGLKPHHCDTCPMKFTCKDHLKRHYRIHTGEKPYRCDMCERAFTQSNDLVKHRRAHLGDNLYKCSQCSESFRLKTELRQHISDHFISQQFEVMNIGNADKSRESDGTKKDAVQDTANAIVTQNGTVEKGSLKDLMENQVDKPKLD